MAVWDAVRSDPPGSLDPVAAEQLAGLGIEGVLIYTEPDCELKALSLPALVQTEAPAGIDVGCDISVSPDGRFVAGGGARWSPDGSQYAICRGTRVDVVPAAGGSAVGSFTGCTPAWRPDGVLTLVRGGAVRAAEPREPIVVPESEIVRAAAEHPNAPRQTDPVTLEPIPPVIDELRVVDLTWTLPAEVAAFVEVRYRFGPPDGDTLVAVFRDGWLRRTTPYLGRYERLVASGGGNVLLEPFDRSQVALFAFGLTPSGPVAWSPDGQRLAVATRASVFVVGAAGGRRVRIPVTVRDLAWR